LFSSGTAPGNVTKEQEFPFSENPNHECSSIESDFIREACFSKKKFRKKLEDYVGKVLLGLKPQGTKLRHSQLLGTASTTAVFLGENAASLRYAVWIHFLSKLHNFRGTFASFSWVSFLSMPVEQELGVPCMCACMHVQV
jgi:hypothetical protein